jgi:hypothetical protein
VVCGRCQKEAAWAITNLCLGGAAPHLDALLAAGCLEPYCALLSAPDHKAVSIVLDGLTNLLQVYHWPTLACQCTMISTWGEYD